ncbi:GUN4 domain-containing protein, partial [Dolichospermum sp. ST_sed5]|nr:GUN4 domain-containing protein [Dolichospermum sp. ST_sed5]
NQNAQLKSSSGMDYKKLRDLLAQGKWKEADEETVRIMLAVGKREKESWLDTKSLDNFPCEDLHIIDKLWVKHSNGKFGFSVQQKIYQSCGGTLEYEPEIWEKYGEKVGWKKKKLLGMGGEWITEYNITFDITAPAGHLPSGLRGILGKGGAASLGLRLVDCNL